MADPLAFRVEPMTLADLDQVIEIERASFSAPWSRQAYRFEITQNAHSTMRVVRPPEALARNLARPSLGATEVPSVVAYGGFWMLVDKAHVATIAVHPNWRGLGLGELLLLALLEQGLALGAARATLEVRVSNLVAQNLYLKCGFEIVARNKRYYADNDEDAYIMATPSLADREFQARIRRLGAALNARFARLTRASTETQSG